MLPYATSARVIITKERESVNDYFTEITIIFPPILSLNGRRTVCYTGTVKGRE